MRTSAVNWIFGKEERHELFMAWTDGAFSVANINGTLYAQNPVNREAVTHSIWSGPDINNLNPLYYQKGFTVDTHSNRGINYDLGWWPYTLRSDDNGKWYCYAHAEDKINVDTGIVAFTGNDMRTIALWTSEDQGRNWKYEGVVISIDDQFAVPGHLQSNWPRNGGAGDHKLIIDPHGKYLYIAYTSFTFAEPGSNTGFGDNVYGNLCMARATIESNGMPGSWQKFYNGSYSEPGIGGHETWVMSPQTGAGGGEDNSQRSIQWNTYLKQYVMIFARRTRDAYIAFSKDLIEWTKPEPLMLASKGVNYTNILSADYGGTDQIGGKNIWVYYTSGANYNVFRRLLQFGNQENIAAHKLVISKTGYSDSLFANSHLTDGNARTLYSSIGHNNSHHNEWMCIDLGAQQTFNQIRLYPRLDDRGAGFPETFTIEGANQLQESWSILQSYESFVQPVDGATLVCRMESQRFRYVRINVQILGSSFDKQTPYKLQLAQIQIYNQTEEEMMLPIHPPGLPAIYRASSGFSQQQGHQQWSYVYNAELTLDQGQPENWSIMQWNETNLQWEKPDSTACIGLDYQQPDCGVAVTKVVQSMFEAVVNGYAQDSFASIARVWKTPAEGMVRISGVVELGSLEGNGAKIRIMRNRQKIWPMDMGWAELTQSGLSSIAIDLAAYVDFNDRIFFIVQSKEGKVTVVNWDPCVHFYPVQFVESFTQYISKSSSDESWLAPNSGMVHIGGRVRINNLNPEGADIQVKIMHKNNNVWPQSEEWQTLQLDDTRGVEVDAVVSIHEKDKLSLVAYRDGHDVPVNVQWDSIIKLHVIESN